MTTITTMRPIQLGTGEMPRREPIIRKPCATSRLIETGAGETSAEPTKEFARIIYVFGPEYHDGDDLISRLDRLGEAAFDRFCERWSEGHDCCLEHSKLVFFRTSYKAAGLHLAEHGEEGSRVLELDAGLIDGLEVDPLSPTGARLAHQLLRSFASLKRLRTSFYARR